MTKAVAQLPGREREHENGDELGQTRKTEREGLVGDRVELPADRNRLNQRRELGEDAGGEEQRQVAGAIGQAKTPFPGGR